MGTVFAVQFALRLPQRRMLLVYGVLLVVGSVLAASATASGVFIVGHVLQGLCTSLLLIAAFPPLIVGYPPAKLRWTAMVVNFCVFGAVALGPAIGGIQASAHAWRPLFWIIAGIALAALALSVLTFQDAPPVDPRRRWDPLALGLAATGCAAAFFGASELLTHAFLDAITFVPLIGGLALIVTLLIAEYRGRCSLLNVRPLVSTLPATGILVAICAAAASVSAITLSGVLLAHRVAPLHAGLLYLPEFAGAALSAIVFGFVFRTRGLHYQVLAGMIFLSVGIVVIGRVLPPTDALALTGSGLIGLGVGSSVVPALFIAGFSLPNSNLQRVFAIIELLRAVAAFMIAPLMLPRLHGRAQPELRDDDRTVDLLRDLRRRCDRRRLPVRAGRRPPTGTLAGAVVWRPGARLVLATTACPHPAPDARGAAAAPAFAATANDDGDDAAAADRLGSCFRPDRPAQQTERR